MSTLAERFAELFAERPEVKAVDLARACHVKAPSVAGWMSGKTKQMEAENAIRAAEFFGVHTWWLATGLGPKRIKEGERDKNVPEFALRPEGWPFTIPFDRYQRLSSTEQRALDRVVSAYVVGCISSAT